MLSDSFDANVVGRNGRSIVYVRGEIDVASGPAFRDALARAQQGGPDVIVDLSGVTFMDSTGLNALIGAYRRAPDQGSLRVVSPTPAVRRVLEITAMAEILLTEPQQLTWQQVTYHTSGWRQWTTRETTTEGRPVAEIIEIGSQGPGANSRPQYSLETDGQTTLHPSLGEAIKAGGLHRSQVCGSREEYGDPSEPHVRPC